MNYAGIFDAGSLVWPLTVLLIFLIILRQARDDLQPVYSAIIGGVAKNAQSNAVAYAIAIMFGVSASLMAFIDVFKDMDATLWASITWHQYAALWARVAEPFIVAVLAYATQNKFQGGGLGGTTPPFPPPAEPQKT